MKNLKELRTANNLSQQKLAEKLGVTQQAIYNYENGLSEPDIYMLTKIAKLFCTSVDYLIGYSDEPYLPSDQKLLSGSERSQHDCRHMLMYKKLSPDMQTHIDCIIEGLLK